MLLPPARPTGLAAAAGDGRVTLSWNDPGDATVTRWQVRRREGAGAWSAWADIPGSGKDTAGHTVTGLANGAAYGFQVRAANAAGEGPASAEVAATPPVLRAPAGLAAVAGDGEVTLSWDDPGIDTLAGWQVQYRAVGGDRGDWTDIAGSDQGTTGHTP